MSAPTESQQDVPSAERFELGFHRPPLQPVTAANQHPFDIGPVAGTISERLEYDEI